MVLDNFKLNGKVAMVTGCNTGLGQGMALGMAEAGATIIAVNRDKAEETEKKLKEIGNPYFMLKADLSSIDVIPALVKEALASAGKIDILVNNAGIIRREDSLVFSEKDWDDVMNVNSKVLFFLSQAVANHYIARKVRGKIINICSMLSFQGGIRVPSYTASKSAAAGLTRLMANEWAQHNINVNALAPGYMDTDNTAPIMADPERAKAILSRIPAGSWGLASDLQGPIVFLASDASNYLHGAIIPVDGGWLAR